MSELILAKNFDNGTTHAQVKEMTKTKLKGK